jgi:amino acid adenylation domain-containing protein
MTELSHRLAAMSPARRALLAELRRERTGAIGPRPLAARIPLSFAQQRMWFLDQYEPARPIYNVYLAVRLSGHLDVTRLRGAVNTVVARHEVLRTTFAVHDGRVEPALLAEVELPVPVIEVAEHDAAEHAGELAREPFDLATGPLLRACLLRTTPREHLLVLAVHHIAADGWSLGVFVAELTALYLGGEVEPLPVQYADFAHWQRVRLAGPATERELAYWRERLAGAPAVLELPTDRPRPARRSGAGRSQVFSLDRRLVAAVGELAKRERVTLFMILLAAFDVVLARYSGQTDVCVGTPIANRTRPEVEGLIGYFANTLVLRTDLGGDPTFRELLHQVRDVTVGAYDHQEVPFERLVEDLSPARDASHSPLFQVMLVLQNAPMPALVSPELTITGVDLHNGTAKLDLTLMFFEEDGELLCRVEYATDLFDDATISRFTTHFQAVLTAATTDPDSPVWTVELLSEVERDTVLRSWNDTATPPRPARLVHELIADQADRTPDAAAVESEDGSIGYRELDERANRLAHRLRELGVGPEVPVGVLLERSPDLVVTLLAILKAGGAYLPLEPAYPDDRVADLLRDTGARILVTTRNRPDVIVVDPRQPDGPAGVPVAAVSGASLAYVIYTSGSTGAPKGVMGTHQGMLNRLLWLRDTYRLDETDRPLLKTPYSVDTSIEEIFLPLIAGGCVVVARPDAHRDPAHLVDVVVRRRVTRLRFVPSLLVAFLAEPGVAGCTSLRQVFSGGERLPRTVERRFLDVLGAELHNVYGPTEASIDVTAWHCRPEDVRQQVPIGTPMANTRIHLLDANLRPVPIGVAGELFIGGVCLSRGYLGLPGRTAERFVADPFTAGERLYRTGDRARYLPDGEIEYLDRSDRQVKVRGFRVEPGEVEAVLLRCPGVGEAAVVASPDRDGLLRLVAYLVADADIASVRDFLGRTVPQHLVPSAFVFLDALPLNATGKVDRRALPALDDSRPEVGRFVPPSGTREEELARIWKDVLGLAEVGAHDNFFALGGDSIRTIRVVSLAREQGIDLSLHQLFEHQTIRSLARSTGVERATGRGEPPVLIGAADRAALPADVEDAYPLSTMQAGMVFDREFGSDFATHHLVLSFHLRGRFDAEALAEVLAWSAARHPILRTSFDLASFERPLQLVHRRSLVPLEVEDLRAVAEQDAHLAEWIERERVRPFDLSTPPLVRLHVHRRGDDDFQFTMSSLALVLDGWSSASFLTELFEAYAARIAGRDLPAGAAPTSHYRDFVSRELAVVDSVEHRRHWTGVLADTAAAGLPRPTTTALGRPGERIRLDVPVDEEVSRGVRRLAADTGVPLKSVLLAAHLRVLSLLTGERTVLTGLVANSRLEETDGERVLGQFLNVVPLAVTVSDGSWTSSVRTAFEAERAGLPARHFPVVLLRPRFETAFNFVHFHVYGVLDHVEGVELIDAVGHDGTNFQLFTEFSVDPLSSRVQLGLEYDAGRFTAGQVAEFAGFYSSVLAAMAADDALELLSDVDRQARVHGWNDTAEPGLADRTITELFAEQVSRDPDATALVADGRRFSFRELDECSNELAHRLDIAPQTPVGVRAHRSAQATIAMLAVLKAGGVCVPMDPDHPADRVRAEARLGALLTAEDVDLTMRRSTGPMVATTPEQLACLVFTSGSTGRPKGVGLPHRQIVNRLNWLRQRYPHTAGEVGCQKTSPAFVDSLWELFDPLLSGIPAVVVPDEDVRDPYRLAATLAEHGVTRILLVPTLLRMLLSAHDDLRARLPRLDLWMTSGEPLPDDLCRQFAERLPGAVLVNVYGSTEAWDATYGEPLSEIGTAPLANMRAYVLDAGLRLLPVGVPGELYVGGDGVARGYVHNAALTARRFVADPFLVGQRVYRTGDRARYLPGGRIELLGRTDAQLKVHGVRVEPGEVESVLTRHPAVRQAVVTAGDRGLTAFLLTGGDLDRDALRRFAREHLPAAMVPAVFVELDALPLTATGKLDRSALVTTAVADRPDRAAPATPTELRLRDIWAEVLRHEEIGTLEDFFALGGNSLLATRVVARVRRAFDVELTVRALFDAPTIVGLGAAIDARPRADGIGPVTPGPRGPLSSGQRSLWFLDQLDPGGIAYNEGYAVRLRGALDVSALDRALTEIMRRHESLRTAFDLVDGEPVQRTRPVPDQVLREVDGPLDRVLGEEVRRPFDLAAGPLLRATLVRLGATEHVALLVLHHIACDAWSIRILMRELTVLYQAFSAGQPSPLPELEVQYADYADWQRRYLRGDRLDELVRHWRNRLDGAPAALDLAPGRTRGGRGATESRMVPAVLARAVDELGGSHGATLFMTLLAAFVIVLNGRTGQEDVVVGTDVAGRGRTELEGLIGFFVNQLVLRVDLSGNPSFATVLDRARETTLTGYAHQDLSFDRLVEALRPDRDPRHSPVFQAKLVLQNVPDEELRLADLELSPVDVGRDAAQVELNLRVSAEPAGLLLSAQYDADLFETNEIAVLLAQLTAVLERVTAAPDTRLAELGELMAAVVREEARRVRGPSVARLRTARRRTAVDRTEGEK